MSRRPAPDLLNAPLTALTALTGARGGLGDALPVTGLRLMADPAAVMTLHWSSPTGRLLEIATTVTTPGGWCALRLTVDLPDLAGIAGLGLWLRASADPALTLQAVLRSAHPAPRPTDGPAVPAPTDHVDTPLAHRILCHAAPSDHTALWLADRHPDLPRRAPWREVLLFLPPHRPVTLSLHTLRLFTVPA